MINLLKKVMQRLSKEFAQYERLRVNDENEYQAMSCGAFNPRFLAKVKRCQTDKNKNDKSKNKSKEKQQ